ncbi:hypothetical protein KOAAANKH_02358 [Brevundimonas sp. NIBR10]|nr:hypothetical protein KOAAANKH_02358 [Brevundimonas sp. NIBR10]
MAVDPHVAIPAHAAIRVAETGEPSIEGFRCADCGAIMIDQPMACRACTSRTPPQAFRVGERGRIVTWSTVLRSFPGVKTPFVSAIVDLDDGLTLKGTVRGVDPESLGVGLPVSLVFDDAGGARAPDGAPYVGFHFVKAGAAE